MEQKNCLKLIYKIPSKLLKKSNWKLDLPLDKAMSECRDLVVSLNDSQLLRFIDEINGNTDVNSKVRSLQRKIKLEKKKPKSKEVKEKIRSYYSELYSLQFQKDYVCVVMNSNKDYDRANLGFEINGIQYRRFLGTNGGIKNSTIVYVNATLYPELKKRLDNGRNMQKELVPAKLEAYQALICSGSTPLPEPKGIIVVKDCITHFKDNVILINDETEGEPILTHVDGYEIEHNDSDGYGLMLPSYSRRVNEYLNGNGNDTISGMNTRYAWTKGMVYTFDFIEFAEKVAGTYEVTDIWGDKRDLRDCEVILTESMLKLWDSYQSWEDFYRNCQENHYQFSTPKITPDVLENVRNTNYQFLQSYQFTDEELHELCQPTIEEIQGVLGMDYRKSLVFLAGFGLNEENVFGDNLENYIKALMADERMIYDPFVRGKISNMIAKRIEMAKKGVIKINANYAMISGDPYALCQSIFGLEVTGILKAGEVYHKYWIDKGSDEISCFRAPMTCHNNVRRMKLNKSAEAAHWYQYIKTVSILNCWDTTCDAMNGADKDGDTNMDTDNPIIVRNTLNSPTIVCVQRKADKTVPTEDDIIQANKLAFNDDIGVVTNHVTSMFEVQAGYSPGTKEYEALDYRIMCGQLYQQNTIDRAKGIIAKPMPQYWYNPRDNIVKSGDSAEVSEQKRFHMSIAAARKPYFMTYVYPNLRAENSEYEKNCNYNAVRKFAKYDLNGIQELKEYEPKTPEMEKFLRYYEKNSPVGKNPCVVNRICWIFEDAFRKSIRSRNEKVEFDYLLLKSNTEYLRGDFIKISDIYRRYQQKLTDLNNKQKSEKTDSYDSTREKKILIDWFRRECEQICPNENELCDIVLDICYGREKSKQFAWDICGNVIVRNLLKRNGGIIHYPEAVPDAGDFEYCGVQFVMQEKKIGGDALVDSE